MTAGKRAPAMMRRLFSRSLNLTLHWILEPGSLNFIQGCSFGCGKGILRVELNLNNGAGK
jgi:hypothetical protein